MTGIKGQTWSKPKVNKYKKNIQLTNNDLQFVERIASKKKWSVSKIIYEIFLAGRKIFKVPR